MTKLLIKPKAILTKLQLTKIPDEVFSNKELIKLNLSQNKIKDVPKEIGDLTRLETVDISNNKIRQVYSRLFQLSKLKILNLNNNKLINIPKQVDQLISLREIHLSNNQLKELPDEFGRLQQLITLNLSYNQFKVFPESILKLKKLKTIWIGGNFFKEIPFTKIYNELPELKRIYTYSNISYENNTLVDQLYLSFCGQKRNVIHQLQNKIVHLHASLKEDLLDLISNDNFDAYFSTIFKTKLEKESEIYSQLLNLHPQWKELKYKSNIGTIDLKDRILQKNKIREQLINITTSLDATG